ncbi:MAG TPA: L-fucose dehydrogenase, partial [Stenotrophomonas sp.]|nr:L-fucose dehydrogenase [Stenotrophomonas sp.]
MTSRRRFLSLAAAAAALSATAPLFAQSPAPGSVLPTRGTPRPGATLARNPPQAGGRYRP